MFTLVEFCSSNMLKGTEDMYKTLDEDPEIDVLDYGCLNNCGLCSKAFFVLVEGQIVSATTPEKLLEKIYKRIDKLKKEEESWFEDLS
ncbi:YuzB family protein [Salinicoccus sp. HZC-1]|uniref:YuzB family protein n=1 Tax=Salinicoccus sp. HZC-1 TaxID=3385497 RepID=UPI00398B9A56